MEGFPGLNKINSNEVKEVALENTPEAVKTKESLWDMIKDMKPGEKAFASTLQLFLMAGGAVFGQGIAGPEGAIAGTALGTIALPALMNKLR
jgi:hypothetical protein